jgi:hypothetical protein
MLEEKNEKWDLWYPKAAAAGIPFARSIIRAEEDIVLVHAAPQFLTVEVYSEDGQLLAQGQDLEATQDTPMTRLVREDGKIARTDIWPSKEDLGRLVLLPGGEAGTLLEWWNAEDQSSWRWKIEFYNEK